MGQRCHNRNKNFPLGIHCVDGFFLEENGDVLIFELPDVFQTIQCVSGKSADGLCNNHIDVSGFAFVNHAIEFITVLGIGAGDTDSRIDFIGGIRGLKELERRADNDMKVSFSMYPTSITELFDVADQKLLMPPKSTWFEPKLRSGLFIHEI